MKKPILGRYEMTEQGKVVIDVSIRSVEHLYHDFDKTAPYHRKELDQEFAEYLTECVQEIGKHPFVIRISLETMPDDDLMDRVRKSINNYFRYLREIEIRSMKVIIRRSAVLFSVGLILLILAILATRHLGAHKGVIEEVFAEGLTIAAWVSLWEALVHIFLEWRPVGDTIRRYNRIIDSEVIFGSRFES